MSVYQNPNRKPLEKLELSIEKNGVPHPVPALSEVWMNKKTFLEYEPPKIYDSDGNEILGAKDRWLNLVSDIINDLKWLLRLECYKFWSNILHNPTICDCLVSCLQELPIFYNFEMFPNCATMRDSHETLRRIVFLIFARLVTRKESDEEFISLDAHGKFLYDKYLLTIPMMLDICQLYGRENDKAVGRIITTAMKLQPSYENDLRYATQYFVKALKEIDRKFDDRAISLSNGLVPLAEKISPRSLTIAELDDLVVYLLDVASNISVFLDCYPPARDFLYNDQFINEIVHVYGTTIPEIYRRLEPIARNDDTIVRYMEVKHRLDVTRIELLKLFHTIAYQKIDTILQSPKPSEVPDALQHVDQFVNFLIRAITEEEFMLDYHNNYPNIEIDLNRIPHIFNDFDPEKLNIIKNYMNANTMIFNENSQRSMASNATAAVPSTSQQTVTIPDTHNGPMNKTSNGPTKCQKPEDLTSLIKEVKDILYDLGEGFIERCLKHYNNNAEAVINAVFENSLPEHLGTLDRTLPLIPPDPAEASAEIDRVLGSERLNVFDNDEFDIMTRDTIDKSRVHKGKRKDKYKNFGALLDDKSFMKETSYVYEKYSNVPNEYEDEYDDTYDMTSDVGLREADEPSEMDGRAFTTPRILRWNEKRKVDEEDEEENDNDPGKDEDPGRGQQNDRLNFVQDPAVMRARAEQRRLSKYGGGGGNSSGAGGSKTSRGDVIGNPKGQGNDKSVLVNRDRKNVNKAARANHNRRKGAEHKRKQGMVS